MSVFFSDHARRRMAERSITAWHVGETIAGPTRISPGEMPRVRILQKEFQRRTLEVVVEVSGQHTRVITVYWV